MENEKLSVGMRIYSAVSAVLLVAMGIWLLLAPRYVIWLFFAAVLVQGIHLIIRYFMVKETRSIWDIVLGAINIFFGLAMLYGDPMTRVMGIVTIEVFVAIWAVFAGFAYVFGSFKMKSEGIGKWGWVLAGGILMVLYGICFMSAPLMSAIGLTIVISVFAGVALIISGCTALVTAFTGKAPR